MEDDGKKTMLTTVDTDFHVIDGDIDLVRMKVDHNKWLMTTDGRFVRSDKVVSVWVPSQQELDDYMGGIVYAGAHGE